MIIYRMAVALTLTEAESILKYLHKSKIIPSGKGQLVKRWMVDEIFKGLKSIKEIREGDLN